MRACEEVQGTFALTVEGRGFKSRIRPGPTDFINSECVSCGACVQACPTGSLIEKSVVARGMPEHSIVTTCAYCGVGCSFKAEMRGDELIRMVPYKGGQANEGHSCVKGRFAYGYATHKDRMLKPMMREKITDPWREVSWDEAILHAASELKRLQTTHGRDSIGVITSSRCTNEEVFVLQKLARAAFRNNNVDTCARVCHSPTGYGLKSTLGTSAGTQDFKSVDDADVILLIGANPTDGHPVFASRMKKRLRAGAKLIIADPRSHRPRAHAPCAGRLSPPAQAGDQCRFAQLDRPCGRHRGAGRPRIMCARAAISTEFESWARFIALPQNSPEEMEKYTGVPARGRARRGTALRQREKCRDLLRPRRDRAQPGLDRRHGLGQSGDGDRQFRPCRRRREPVARPEQCPGLLRHGLLPP